MLKGTSCREIPPPLLKSLGTSDKLHHKQNRPKFCIAPSGSLDEAYRLDKFLIETHGQADREQFCVLMLNAKNDIIGLNIVSTGDVSPATVTPREHREIQRRPFAHPASVFVVSGREVID